MQETTPTSRTLLGILLGRSCRNSSSNIMEPLLLCALFAKITFKALMLYVSTAPTGAGKGCTKCASSAKVCQGLRRWEILMEGTSIIMSAVYSSSSYSSAP